jgi:hypothetical protein
VRVSGVRSAFLDDDFGFRCAMLHALTRSLRAMRMHHI